MINYPKKIKKLILWVNLKGLEVYKMTFNSLHEILEDLTAGKIVCLADSEDLENEIDMCCLAEYATPENINYMAKNACGFICNVLPWDLAEEKGIDYLVQKGINQDHRGTPWAKFLDHKDCSTGISPEERSKTIMRLSKESSSLSEFVNGHVPVLKARKGLLKERLGHTEMSSKLSFLAGSNGTAVICEVLEKDNGTSMLRVSDFEDFNKDKGLKIYSLQQLLKDLEFE